MKLLRLLLLLALGPVASASNNILLIIADDFGVDASAVYNTSPGAQLAPTPNIASLAANGVKFSNAYSYTVCSPARSAILTGRYGFRTGTANVVGGAASNNALKAGEFTLPEAFAANGGLNYQLKHIGKWHLGGANTAPCQIGGWPSFAGAMIGEIEDYFAWTKVIGSGASASSSTVTTYATTDNVNDALTFITAQSAVGKPWVTWLAFNAPHIPYHKPPDNLHTYDTTVTGWASLPVAGNELVHYNAAIQAMDTEIGRLFSSMDSIDPAIRANTNIIFIGDNGTPTATLQTPYPPSKGKATLYEGGIRVPLIVSGPAIVSPGRTSPVLTHVVDLYATILELAGINVAATVPAGTALDSQSLLAVLQNQAVTRNRVYGDYWDLAFPALTDSGRVLRDSQYKLVRLKSGTDRFYDLAADPYEGTNLVGLMTAPQTAAYSSLVTQLGDFNTPPTISTVPNQSVAQGAATGALAFTVGDAELSPAILSVSGASSNATLVPAANIVLGGSGASRTVTVTPVAGQNGTSVITLSVTDGIFTATSGFVLSAGTPTTINSITRIPATPTNTDVVTVTASVTPGGGATLSGVQLSYNTGAQVTGPVFREIFANASTASGITGAMNAWTATATRAAVDVKLRGSNANHTAPIVLANCATNGSTVVTCASTTGLIPGMSISGANIAAPTTISAITDTVTFLLSTAATGSGTGLSLTAAGVALSGCSISNGTPNVTCSSTVGLSVGMGVAGAGLATNPPNPAVLSITDATHFVLNNNVSSATASGLTLTASGCGLEFANGTSTDTATMAETANVINAGSASAGNVEFYVRNADLAAGHGWTLDIFDGTTWQPRMSETFAGSAATCNLTAGSSTIACTDTSKLTQGNVVLGSPVPLTGCTTVGPTPGPASNVVTCSNTTGLQVGMVLTANGIPQGTSVTAISANTNFTMSNVATANGTVTVHANYLSANTTISSINPNVSFVVNNAPLLSATGVTLSSVNHGFALRHYDLTAADRNANMKLRFRWAGGTVAGPLRPPTCDIDDIVVTLTTGAPPQTLAMFDDGAHGDGAAGDGVYGATIPVQSSAGTIVSYTVTATDSAAGAATGSGSYTVTAAAPVLAVTPAATLSSAGAAGSGTFSPSGIAYTLANVGTGTMSWTAGKTANWLSLSGSSGTLTAGASVNITASINTASANGLTAASYSDTITFTNGNTGTGNTTRAVGLLITNGVPTAPAPPVVAALPQFSAGTTRTVSWPAVVNATSYTIQIATDAGFTANVVSQTVASTTAGFSNLTHGVTYYYRVLATNSIGSSAYGNVVSSRQDNVAPLVAINSPASGTSATANTITVTGTSSDALSGISAVKVNNVAATSTGGGTFATWTATVPLAFGTNGITATAFDGAGNLTTSGAILVTDTTWQTYNPLYIPDIITGTTFNLALSQKSKQFPYFGTNLRLVTNNSAPSTLGSATTTLGYNGALMWGPTLIMNQGDAVQLNVTNNVPIDTTTVHWHGFHIPAIMDGGPHQVIPSGTTWSPTFTVRNSAATYWYHPHLHVTTQKQLTLGAGGFIIVRDPQEAALALPRTYGVDDIPLALTSRRFVAPNEFGANQYVQVDGTTSTLDNYGDFVLVNGTPTNASISGTTAILYPPQFSLPKQYVRLRILNAEIQRGYNLGFSDNRTFYVIGNDQGLLNAPVPVTRMFLMVGERVEILVNLGSDTIGSSFDLKAYNSGQVFGFPGNEGNPQLPTGASGGENGSLLNNPDFSLLHINVAATTANAITSLPATLANNTYSTDGDKTNTRTIAVTGGNGGTPGFKFDNIGYTPTLLNHTINLNAIEKWTVSAGNIFGHALHIHDIKFNIIARTGGTQVTSNGLAAPYESGWKDTVYIPRGETVSVIAKYDDFASPVNPFMFHCHFLNHEDGGMMGQFVVVNNEVENLAIASFTRLGGNSLVSLDFKSTAGTTYSLQYSADMSTWTDIGSVTSNGSSANFTETDATRLGLPRGFYRVRIPTIS